MKKHEETMRHLQQTCNISTNMNMYQSVTGRCHYRQRQQPHSPVVENMLTPEINLRIPEVSNGSRNPPMFLVVKKRGVCKQCRSRIENDVDSFCAAIETGILFAGYELTAACVRPEKHISHISANMKEIPTCKSMFVKAVGHQTIERRVAEATIIKHLLHSGLKVWQRAPHQG